MPTAIWSPTRRRMKHSAPPTELVFSSIASEDPANQSEMWQTVVDALGAKIDLQVKYLKLDGTKQQLEAIRSSKLHVTALSTGTVPVAVNSAGFVPVCTFGHGDGDFGYQMNFIVRADGNIQKLENLCGKSRLYTTSIQFRLQSGVHPVDGRVQSSPQTGLRLELFLGTRKADPRRRFR